jgi:hypothetical protein
LEKQKLHVCKPLISRFFKKLRVILPLLFTLFLVSNTSVEALCFARNYMLDVSTVKASPVSLANGNSSSCIFSSTNDYVSTTATAGLTFNESATVLVPTQAASPSLDSSNIGQVTSATTGSCTFSTSAANEVIYVAVSILGTTPTLTVTNSSGASLTQRAAVTNSGVRIETWYTIAVNTGSQTITATFASATTFAIIALGVRNANTPYPFDLAEGNPKTGTGTGNTQSVTVGSVFPNTLVLGSVAIQRGVTPSVGSGFTSIRRSNSGGLGEAVEYQSLTATANTSVTFTTTGPSANWAMVGDVIWGKLPTLSVNTNFSTPTSGGSGSIADNIEGYLVSPSYPRATKIYNGTWQLNLYARSASAGGTVDTMLLVTDAAYNVVNEVCSKRVSPPISTSASLVTLNFEQPIINVPSGGHLIIILYNLVGGSSSFTVYWGTSGLTNFKTNQISNYVLRLANSAASSYGVVFSVYSSTSITRLTNMTLYVYTPTSKCIVINNGAFTQTSSTTRTLPSSATLYLAVNATAIDFNSISSIIVKMRFNTTRPYGCNFMNLTLN